MKSIPRPVSGRALALVIVLLLGVLEVVALLTAPPRERGFIGAAVVAGVSVVLVVVSAVVHARQGGRRRHGEFQGPVKDSWFTADALGGFPLEAVRPWLLGPKAPSLNRFYLAWIMAQQGHDSAWITTHVDVPEPVARLLVDASCTRH
jgi:hypothetical protein